MQIRPGQAADRDSLHDLVQTVFQEEERPVAVELIDAAVAGSDDYCLLVAIDVAAAPSGLGGYICYGPTPMTAGTYDLYWIASHPRARGLGVARALVRAMERELEAAQATAIRVETEDGPEYVAARRLYEGLDYPAVAHLQDFYRPGDGLILYYKRLV